MMAGYHCQNLCPNIVIYMTIFLDEVRFYLNLYYDNEA